MPQSTKPPTVGETPCLFATKKEQPLQIALCGERGIRTPGASQHGSFQDYCNRPLYHLSSALIVSKAGAKVRTFFETNKFFANFL